MEPPALRIFGCRPMQLSFDMVLRDEMVPDLLLTPGVLEVHAGRRGPNEMGERLIVSIWASLDQMLETMGDDPDGPGFRPQFLDLTTGRSLEVLPIAFGLPDPDPAPGTIMRLSRGRIRPGELAAYVSEAGDGATEDRARGQGARCLFLAERPDEGFVTFSVWDDWGTLSTATGADVHRPISTRHPERIVEFSVTHYEVLPGVVSKAR